MSSVLTVCNNGVAIITLNRPEKFNSFNEEMAMNLFNSLQQAVNDEMVRCILLTATGKAFCAGQDLSETPDPSEMDFAAILNQRYNPIITLMRNAAKPIICAVNGVAAGAGANIALAGDIVVAKKSASFVQAFINIGLIPDCGGTYFLPRMIGTQRAMGLMLTGEKLSADDALQMGMIFKVFSDDTFEAEAIAFAEKIAQLPTKGIVLTKQLINQSFNNTLEQQLAAEKHHQVEAGNTADFKEGVAAFLEKRKPQFKGQ
jgi:2-(1,2-epoxy-1,2-dihydrophenyl)acetyl-CoA isomerase